MKLHLLTFSAPLHSKQYKLANRQSVVASAVRTFEESNTNITRTVIVGNNTIVYLTVEHHLQKQVHQDLNYVGVAAINSGWMAIDGNGRCKFSTNGPSGQMQEQTY